MFNIFKNKPKDVKGVRNAILQFIKEELKKNECRKKYWHYLLQLKFDTNQHKNAGQKMAMKSTWVGKSK